MRAGPCGPSMALVRQPPPDSRLTDAEPPGRLALAHHAGKHVRPHLFPFAVQHRRPAEPFALPLGARHAGPDPLTDEGPLELREAGEDVQHEVADRGRPGGVQPGLALRAQPHTPPSELLGRGGHVRHAPERPVQFPDDDAVELPPGRLSEQLAPGHPSPQVCGRGVVHELAGDSPPLDVAELPERE